jgi:hypothetical protein
MRLSACLLSIAMLAIMAVSAGAQVVSFIGAGPVQVGMTVEAAEHSMGTKFAPISLPFSEDCWITSRADGKDKAISYVIANGKIVRIDFYPRDGEQINLKTTAGIGIGSTEADIHRAYKDTSIARAPYYYEESEIEAANTRAKLGNHGATATAAFLDASRQSQPRTRHHFQHGRRQGHVVFYWVQECH